MKLFKRIATALGAAALVAALPAQAADFRYVIEGLQGATATLNFSGTDLNGDGTIGWNTLGEVTNPGEVSAFDLSFSGNALVPAFQHGLDDLQVLYRTDTSLMLASAHQNLQFDGSQALFYSSNYDLGTSTATGSTVVIRFSDIQSTALESTTPAISTPVPEPHGVPLMLAGLGAMGVLLRRRGRSAH